MNPFRHQIEALHRRLQTTDWRDPEAPAVAEAAAAVDGSPVHLENGQPVGGTSPAGKARADSLLEFATDGYLTTDPKGLVQDANRAAGALLAVGEGLLVGRPLIVFFAEDEREALQARLARAVDAGDPPDGVWRARLQPRTGAAFAAEITTVPVRDAKGSVTHLRWLIRDVADRGRMVERLEKLIDCFLLFGPDPDVNISRLVILCGQLTGAAGAIYHRIEGGILRTLARWNMPASDGAGPAHYPEQSICCDVIREADDDVLMVRSLPESAASQAGGSAFRLKTYVGQAVKRGGEYVGSFCVVYDGDGRPDREHRALIRRVAAAIGVEENRRQAQQLLRESEAKYRDLVQNASSIIMRRDVQGRVTFFNKFAQEFFGYDEEEILGRNCLGTIVPRADSSGRDLAAVTREVGLHPERHATIQNENMRRNGERVWIAWTNKPVRDERGRIVEILCIGNDLTERRRLEREILEIAERERERIGRDLHDSLGQNLIGVAILCKRLEKALAAEGSAELSQAKRIGDVILQTVELTRAVSRGLCPVGVSPDGLMAALCELAGDTQRTFGIQCRFDYEDPVLLSDRTATTQLYHIVQEAVNNAIKHGKAGFIRIRLSQTDDEVTLTVVDDGVGLPEEATGSGRAGMGLRIMKHRASMIGGSLTVRRGDHGGTVVSCCFRKVGEG